MNVKFLDFIRVHSTYRQELEESMIQAIKSNHYILGPSLEEFEKEYANFCHTKYAIGVGNGLEALALSLKALSIGKDDEVILPSNTFIATALAVTGVGAKPVLVEPNSDTFNITASEISKKITKATKAIMPVHLYGQACEMNPILDLAKSHNIHVIEDNAQAQGAHYQDGITGSFGVINATSFYPGKNLGALGDGGGITTNSDDLATVVRKLRNYGSTVKYDHEVIGTNSRLDEILASGLRVKLKHLSTQNAERQKIASKYNSLLAKVPAITTPVVAKFATHVYHLYVIKAKRRDELKNYLSSKGIDTLIHYPIPIHKQKAYSGVFSGEFPIATNLSNEILSLPIYPGLTDDEIQYVCETIKSFYR